MSDASNPELARPSNRNRWFAFGALAVAGLAFVVITYGGIGENLVYYWGPSDLRAAGDKAIGAHHPPGRPGGGWLDPGRGGALQPGVRRRRRTGLGPRQGQRRPPQMFREGSAWWSRAP